MKRKILPITNEELIYKYSVLMISPTIIAEECGCSSALLYKRLKELGCELIRDMKAKPEYKILHKDDIKKKGRQKYRDDPEYRKRHKIKCHKYYLEHKDVMNAESREYRSTHKEELKIYRRVNKDKINEQGRIRRALRKDEINANRRQRRKDDPEYRDNINKQQKESYKKNKVERLARHRIYYKNIYYPLHKDKLSVKEKKWNEEHKVERKLYQAEYYQSHRDEVLERTHTRNRVKAKEINLQNAVSNQKVRVDVLTHYGNGQCVCVKCGYDDMRALTIDHINGNGKEERKKTRNKGVNFYGWLQRNCYPEGYQTLCANCQLRKKIDNKEQTKFSSKSDDSKKDGKIYSPKYRYEYYHSHKPQVAKWVASSRFELKQEILTHYGNGKCVCVRCGEDDIKCLSIDHIDGKGAEHRKKVVSSSNFYRWLKNNDYPEGYQTYCMNCQNLKRVENNEQTRSILSEQRSMSLV
jgi:hypothetical protein